MPSESLPTSHQTDVVIPSTANTQSRPTWMGNEGRQIYDDWANALLDVCDTEAFYSRYATNAKNVFGTLRPHRDYITNLDYTFNNFFPGGFRGPLHEADAAHGISEEFLRPYLEEIMRMTSVTEFAERRGLQPMPAVEAHAHDSLRFAVALPAALANDTFFEQNCPNEVFASIPEKTKQAKLDFVIHSLGNVSLHGSLNSYAIGGFAVIGDKAIGEVEPHSQSADKATLASTASDWLARSIRFGLYDPASDDDITLSIVSAVNYDPATDLYAPKPQVTSYLRESVRQQNSHGFDDEATRTAGDLIKLQPPLSRGCPVAGLDIIGRTSIFAARLLETNAAVFRDIIDS